MSKNEIAVKVENLTKTFRIPLEASNGVKQKLINNLKGRKGYREFTPLKNISFEIEKGDFFGIVGRNGSGKSTLLKTIASIYNPTKGRVQVNGSLVPFIELGVGFNPDLTGRENIFLNGALLGFSHSEMEEMYDEIVDFAEIGDFMDEKLKNYSSGMQVRLAFSIAIRADGDILLLDEVLAVGDEAFQRKCDTFFEQIKNDKSKTIILVTHSMDSVRKYCNKAMMIRDGEIVCSGSPEDVSNEYSIENLQVTKIEDQIDDDKTQEREKLIKNLKVSVENGKQFSQKDDLVINIKYDVVSKMKTRANITINDINRNVPLFASYSPIQNKDSVSLVLKTKLAQVNDTEIKIAVSVRNDDNDVLDFLPDDKSPTMSLRRTDYPNPSKKTKWAILFDRGDWS